MSMTQGELTDHVDLLRTLLRAKERQLKFETLTATARDRLALQINTLIDRVNQIDQGLRTLVDRSSQTRTG